MSKRILIAITLLAVFLTSCAAQQPGTPTLAPVDVQNTAVSSAFTMVAMTQLAVPSATPLPPTEVPSPTPLPTFTPQMEVISIPTLPAPMMQPTATRAPISANGNECWHLLAVGEAGLTRPVRVENQTNGNITTLSLLLLEPNSYAQCGFMPGVPPVKKRASYTVNLPTGNWSFYALIDLGNGRSSTANGAFVVQPKNADALKVIVR